MSDHEQQQACSHPVLRRVLLGSVKMGAEERYLLAAGLSALLCLGYATTLFGARIWLLALLASLSGLAVELVFARVRRKALTGGAVLHGLLLALLLPPSLPDWLVVLAAVFGTVFAKEVFGGAKHCVFNPVLVAAAFVVYSYPTAFAGVSFAHLSPLETAPHAWQSGALLCLACALLMLLAQPGALWIYLGIAVGAYGLARYALPESALPFAGDLRLLLTANGFMFIAALLSVDPAGAPQRSHNRFLFGLIIGAAAVCMRCFSLYENAMLSALLLANIFAPTLDLLFARRAQA